MRETVAEWVPKGKMAIAIDQIQKMPVKQATMTFTLAGDKTTVLGMSYEYEPSGGPLAFILGPILDRQMKKGFNGFIDYLLPAAQAQANG